MVIPSLIKQTFAFLDGNDISNWLEELGCKCEWKGNVLYIDGLIKTAIHRQLDPVNIYVCIAFALFGPYWPWVCGDGLKRINKIWKERLKKTKCTKRKVTKDSTMQCKLFIDDANKYLHD